MSADGYNMVEQGRRIYGDVSHLPPKMDPHQGYGNHGNRGEWVSDANKKQKDLDLAHDHSANSCWSKFARCFGGMWATRQLADKRDDKEAYVRTTLRELVVYLIFLGIFCITTFTHTNYTMFYYTRVLNDLFLDTPYADTRNSLRGSTQVMDFWRFSQTVLLDGLYWEYWYDPGQQHTTKADRNVLFENFLVGMPMMRQQRVRNDSCEVPKAFLPYVPKCYGPYSESIEDKEPYGLRTSKGWTYKPANETGNMEVWGKLATYGGGGYTVELAATKNESKVLLDTLRENIWIDRGTRVVFIDFTVYNANLNLFCIVKLIVEFPPTGGIIPSWSFRTVKLLRYVTTSDYFVMACELIFLFFVFYYIVEEALEITTLRGLYFKSIWNILDLIVIGLSLVVIGYNIYNYITIEGRLEELLEYPDRFANFEQMGYWQVQFNSIVAVCVFFSWFKLFKYISFNKTMTQLSSTLSRCAKDVAGFAVMFFIVFFAFSQLGYLIFGSQVYDFHTFLDSVFTLLRTILGDFNFREIEQANRVLGPIFFLGYVFFVFFVLLNMFLAIINDTYSEVKADIATQRNEFELTDYFMKEANSVLGKIGKASSAINLQNELKFSENSDGTMSFDNIRDAFKRCDYTDLQIEMFFARHGIERDRVLNHLEVKKISDDLTRPKNAEDDFFLDQDQSPTRVQTPRTYSGRSRRAATPTIAVTQPQFEMMNNQVNRLESFLIEIMEKVDIVTGRLNHFDRVKAKKKGAMDEFLNSLVLHDKNNSE